MGRGRGVDELRWHRPVRPGDALSVDVAVADKRASESDSRRGYVGVDVTGRIVAEGQNPAGEGGESAEGELDPGADADPVVTWRVPGMVRRR